MHGGRAALAAVALLLVTACGAKSRQVSSDTTRVPPANAQTAENRLALGEQVYKTLCSACHTMDAPPTLAPPMTHVARHYRQAFTNADSAIASIMDFVRKPSAEKSKMPQRAIQRFGLMPALNIPEDRLHAVAEYVWSLPEPAGH